MKTKLMFYLSLLAAMALVLSACGGGAATPAPGSGVLPSHPGRVQQRQEKEGQKNLARQPSHLPELRPLRLVSRLPWM